MDIFVTHWIKMAWCYKPLLFCYSRLGINWASCINCLNIFEPVDPMKLAEASFSGVHFRSSSIFCDQSSFGNESAKHMMAEHMGSFEPQNPRRTIPDNLESQNCILEDNPFRYAHSNP